MEKRGQTAPRFHATSRPIAVEREATHRAISLAEMVDVPVMIVHVSNREAMEQIRWAQNKGLTVLGETCTQYLVLTRRISTASAWKAEIRLLAAAARYGEPGGLLGRPAHGRVHDLLLRPLPVPL